MSLSEWNEVAADYSRWLRDDGKLGYWLNRAIAAALRPLLSDGGYRCLDLGCGDGATVPVLLSTYKKVVGLDGASEMCASGRQASRHEDVAYLIADLTRPLPFAAASFDSIVCSMVLMSLENVESVMREAHRVLRDGGSFIVAITHPSFSFVRRAGDECRYLESYSYPHKLDPSMDLVLTGYHRPIGFYVEQFLNTGFVLSGFKEVAAECPLDAPCVRELATYRRTASALILRGRRISANGGRSHLIE